MKKKKILLILVGIIGVVGITISIICVFLNSISPLEREAKQKFNELKDIIGDDIILTDAVCITRMYYGDEQITYCYLFFYDRNGLSDSAFFTKRGYVGNGTNGGVDLSEGQKSLNNIQALTAQKTYVEYLLDGSNLITKEQAQKNVEGLIPLNIKNIW